MDGWKFVDGFLSPVQEAGCKQTFDIPDVVSLQFVVGTKSGESWIPANLVVERWIPLLIALVHSSSYRDTNDHHATLNFRLAQCSAS